MFPGLKSSLPMISDAPVSTVDYLTFTRYLKPLTDMLFDPLTETPLTVGVFGRWGSGKTTLMQMIDEKASAAGYPTIWFNPWLYQSEENLIVPLLHTIHDWLQESKLEQAKAAAELVATVIAKVAAALLIKRLTMDTVSLDDIEKRVKQYTDKQGAAISALRTLRKQLQDVVKALTHDGEKGRVILFIDDLDRCVPTKIIGLLEAVKLFLDLKHVVIFMAIDRDVVQQGIRVHYKEFKLESDPSQLNSLTADYLDKMVQLPFFLYPLATKQVGDYLDQLSKAPDIQEHSELFRQCLLPNPRKIKRVINVYRLARAVAPTEFQGPESKDKRALLAKIVMIQHQWGDLYNAIAAHSDLAAALERVYRGTLNLNTQPQWAEFKDRQELIRGLCKIHYLPETELLPLFAMNPGFAGQDVHTYLHLLG